MVRGLFLLIFFIPFTLFGVVKVQPKVVQYPDGKVEGWLVIYHLNDEEVDPSSALMGNKPVELDFSSKSNWTGDYENEKRSVYQFELPNKSLGIHVLPSFSIQVGEDVYSSYPLSYRIERKVPKKPLVLQAEIKASEPLYPGQRFSFIYRILYRGSITIEEQRLPLLHPEGFIKIGPLQVNEYEWESYNVQEFTQELQAKDAGTYQFPSSFIAGIARYFNDSGKSVQEAVTSTTSAKTLRVHPFPSENKPPSFEGVVGSYRFTSRLDSPSNLQLGDSVKLVLEISGSDDFHTSELPVLMKQPGFAGFFDIEGLPTLKVSERGVKSYTLSLRPTTTLLSEIPSIEFSSFVPQTETYEVVHTRPIPIQIASSAATMLNNQIMPNSLDSALIPDPNVDEPIEISMPPPSSSDHWTPTFVRSHFWDLVFLLALAITLQVAYKGIWVKWREYKNRASRFFWEQAKQEKKQSFPFYRSLQIALQESLKEVSPSVSKQLIDDIESFIKQLNQARFSPNGVGDDDALWEEGKKLYHSIRRNNR